MCAWSRRPESSERQWSPSRWRKRFSRSSAATRCRSSSAITTPSSSPSAGKSPVARKVMSMADAIGRFIPDGSTVALGTALEPLIPFAAGHELIRQGRRDLELVGPISDALFDELIGAGCVRRITAAWVGNVSEGLGHCYRRACEEKVPRAIEVHDHSNFSISLALWAAAWNVPSLPSRTLLGSGIVDSNPNFKVSDGLAHINAVRPDVAIVHVQ